MSKIVYWTADLETGFHDIDEQHKQLVHYINEFYKAYESGDKQVMNTVLFDLIACSMNHFEYEEGLMAKAGYPLLEPHRRVHQNFVNKLVALQDKLFQGEDVVADLLGSLDGWLFRHIKINDRGYINSVNEAGVYKGGAVEADAADELALPNVAAAPVAKPEPVTPAVTAWHHVNPHQPQPKPVPEAKPEPKKQEEPHSSWANPSSLNF